MEESDRTASLMSPSKLVGIKPKVSSSPAAWLNQMASDAGRLHVRRLAELRRELEARAVFPDFSSMAMELTQLGEALSQLDFELLKSHGWWARTTGKDRTAAAEFADQVKHIDGIAQELVSRPQDLQQKQQEQAAAAERTLMEIEVEFHAIDKIIDQGARWLQDMRTQLKTRQAQAADETSRQKARDDTARCEILVERLKALRATVSTAQQLHQLAQDARSRRAALLQLLQGALVSNIKDWRACLSGFAANNHSSSVPNLEGPKEAHSELRLCVKKARADCTQLQMQEKALVDSIAAFGAQLETVH